MLTSGDLIKVRPPVFNSAIVSLASAGAAKAAAATMAKLLEIAIPLRPYPMTKGRIIAEREEASTAAATKGLQPMALPVMDSACQIRTCQRLDQLLVSLGLFAGRSRARDAVQRGTVKVGGKVVTKAGALFGDDAAIEIDDPAQEYVSRAALKLDRRARPFQARSGGASLSRCRRFDRRLHRSAAGARCGAGHRDRCRAWPDASAHIERSRV